MSEANSEITFSATLDPSDEINFSATLEPSDEITFSASLDDSSGTFDHRLLNHRDDKDQHPINAITGLQDALDSIKINYTYEQAETSTKWTINHNLGKYPAVTVVDSSGNVFYPAIRYVDQNTCVITMNAPMNGTAYLN